MQSIRTIQDFKAFQERISRIENLCQNKCFSLFNCFFFARSKPLINPTILYNPPLKLELISGKNIWVGLEFILKLQISIEN